jgi:serine O-acetyltransferase
MSRARECREQLQRLKMDAARWILPMAIGDVDQVTPGMLARLAWRHPGLRVMVWFRLSSLAKTLGVRGLPMLIQHRLLSRYGVELIPGDDIGGGLYIAHPVGCTLVAEHIGENVTIISSVTFGYKSGRGWPSIGDRAYFGAGCRVLGAISIGADAVVGANAVVLEDVAPNVTVVGLPARPVGDRRRERPALTAEDGQAGGALVQQAFGS